MLDWDDVKIFLSLCDDRTFAGAARELGVDQTTVGRRLAAMERHLCAKLFERTPDGLLLTATGQEIWAAAQNMEQQHLGPGQRLRGRAARYRDDRWRPIHSPGWYAWRSCWVFTRSRNVPELRA
jgi:DNA-binding transcriptional LysR family regulator